MGRPSKYSKEIAEKICNEIAHGKSLVAICKTAGIPDYSTVLRWLAANEEFRGNYARAREEQAEYYAQEIIEIADEIPICQVPDPDGGVSERVDAAGIQRNKLRVDARKWIACKLLPKKYGEKVGVEVSGELTTKSDEELLALLNELRSKHDKG